MSKDKKEEMLDQAAELRHLSRSKPVKVIAVTAGKGGVGKSNVSINLALALAQREKNVLLLDADLGLANIDVMLGLHAKYNLSHVVQGLCHLSDIILQGPDGVRIIPAASGTESMTQLSAVEHAGIIDAFNELTEDVDYMIIDTAAGISDTVLSFARSSQELIVIVCDEPTSLTDAYALIKVMSKRYEWSHFHILGNMVRSAREGKELFNKIYRVAEQFLDVRLDYLGAIPFDEKVHEAVKKQKPVLISYPESNAAKAFIQVADTVEDWPYKPLLGGNTSFFIERLVAGEY
ncbi:flagellar biosynthesis MinD [Legionella maceachernii]|uniref:Flagellar biosynthesis MinD n=2 Tax=Legionellaceae TaxID=444 RepID=A0A0W0W0V2_9GAMM|nr:MinD/ParA family protein [Legionella maceachernii]KTD25935.1 flagellar biosynthesis MinD [Legionella maceachernii]SJZ48797.1 flagellar biosynthesis protein FlhG [Legionella maceachernii]SUP03820.1 cell division inhibitor MinD [Legionella maceachernii]